MDTELHSNENVSTTAGTALTRVNIQACDDIRLVDSNAEHKLDMFCSVHYENESDELVRNSRGIIFHGDSLVSKGLPFCDEMTTSTFDMKKIESITGAEFSKSRMFESHEGTLIRVFYYDSRWWIVTHRKLDAFKSKWASDVSFGTSFIEAIQFEASRNESLAKMMGENWESNLQESFLGILDQTKQYLFLVRNNSGNRIVCKQPENPTVYHVGTFIGDELNFDEDINIPHPNEKHFDTDQTMEFLHDCPVTNLQGLIMFGPNGRIIKIYSDSYYRYFNVRGNEPSIKFRYLQVRMYGELNTMLYELYPDMSEIFDKIENDLYRIAKNLYKYYCNRYIRPPKDDDERQFQRLPYEQFAIIKACHNWHKEDRKNNRVSQEKIIDVMNEQSATSLNRILSYHRFHSNKTRLPNKPRPLVYLLKKSELQKESQSSLRKNEEQS